MMEESYFPRNICRLCGEENSEGSSIFQETHFQVNIITLINKYLPIRISDNDKLPKFICQSCSLQLYSTIFFLEVVITGQAKLRDIFQLQKTDVPTSFATVDLPLPSSSITSILPSHHPIISSPKLEPFTHNTNVSDPLISSSVSSQMDAQREQYKAMSHLMSPSQVMEASHTAHSNTLFSEFGDDIKKIFSLPLDETPLYSDSHDLCTKTIALNDIVPKEPPKKKRGRPRKDASKPPPAQTSPEDLITEVTVKRKRKVPQRYMEGVQSAELEKIFSGPDSHDVKAPGYSAPAPTPLPPPHSLTLEDLEPFNIAASDHILDATTPLNPQLAEHSLTGNTVPDPKAASAPLQFPETSVSSASPKMKLERDDTKVRKRKKRRMYLFCEVCKKSFRQILKLKMHRHTHNPLYKCSQCSLHFHIFSNWEEHQVNTLHTSYEIVDQTGREPLQTEDSHVMESFVVEGENRKITCRHCAKEFHSREALVMHMKLVLNKGRAFACPLCRHCFPLYSRLRQHMGKDHKSSSRRLCVCDICHKQFTHPSSVLYHKETAHSDEQYQCGKCDKTFRHQQLLQRHQLVHMDTRPFPCPTCPMSFKTRLSREAHAAKHTGATAHVCEICHKTLTHRSSLISHYRWHQGIKPHQCPQCPKAFNQKGNLKEHFRIHTGEKPFSCTICSRSFTTYSQHKLHMKRHSGEKPHRCHLCHKGFLSAESYKCHLRRHRGEKPFPCAAENCGLSFVEAWALKKHQRVHRDPAQGGDATEPPPDRWQCPHCQKTYLSASALQKHMKTHAQSQQESQDQQSENNAALLNIDLSLLDMTSGTKEGASASTSEELDKLPRTDSVAAFSEPEGNVFYLYEDSTGLIPVTVDKSGLLPITVDKSGLLPITVDKSGLLPITVDKSGLLPVTEDKEGVEGSQQTIEVEQQQHEMLQNQSFELVTDGSKFQFVRLPLELTGAAGADPPLLSLEEEPGGGGGDKLEGEGAGPGEEENYIEFITEDGGHVRMMGVSYNSLQLLTLDPGEMMFTTKN